MPVAICSSACYISAEYIIGQMINIMNIKISSSPLIGRLLSRLTVSFFKFLFDAVGRNGNHSPFLDG